MRLQLAIFLSSEIVSKPDRSKVNQPKSVQLKLCCHVTKIACVGPRQIVKTLQNTSTCAVEIKQSIG